MKRKYYSYILFILLIVSLGATGIYISLNFPLIVRTFSNSVNKADGGNLRDSVEVIRLTKEAFNLRLTNPQNSIELASRSLDISKSIQYIPGIAEAYRVIGVGYWYLNNSDYAVKNYIEALRHFKIVGDLKNEARVYNNIGNLYKLNDVKKSMFYFNKSLTIAKALKNEELMAGIYFNIGSIYAGKFENDKALINFDNSYKIFKKLRDTLSIISYYQNTGIVYRQLNQLTKAKSQLLKAIAAANNHKLYALLSGCYLTLSSIYIDQNQYRLAERAISKGLKYSEIIKSRKRINDFLQVSYELELKRKDYKKALKHLSLVYHNDSILLNENLSSNIDFTTRHYTQLQKLQEKELIIAKQKYREAKFRWIITLSFLIFILCAIAVLIGYLVRQKRRKRKEVIIQSEIASLEQKALQAMMNPHFVFNVMNSIQYFINGAETKTANKMLSGFSQLMRKHLEICMNPVISVQEELVYLELYLSLEKIRFSDKMEYQVTIDEDVEADEIMIPSMLVQPFVENAIWHGIMPKDEGGLIQLSFDLVDSYLLISIIDNGVGIANSESEKNVSHISRGMTLIQERVELLNRINKRKISIEQHQTGDYGTSVMIRIPV